MKERALRSNKAPQGATAYALPTRYERLVALSKRNPQRALRHVRAAWARQLPEQTAGAWETYTLGVALLQADQVAEALPLLQQAQRQFQAVHMEAAALHARRAQLGALLVLGGGDGLEQQWDELAAAYERAGLLLDAARARFDQVAYRNSLGQWLGALQLVDRLAPLIEDQGGLEDRARLLRLTGVACRGAGALDRALDALDQSVALYGSLRHAPALAKTLFERSIAHQRREQFPAALADLERARQVFGRLGNRLWFAFCAMETGLITSRLGQYDLSIASTLRARTALAELEMWPHVASCDVNLGNVAYYSGLFELAQVAYQQAEALFRSLGRQHMTLVARRNQALVLRQLGEPARSVALLDELAQLADALGDQVEAAELLYARGLALRDLGAPDDALGLLARAEAQFERLGSQPARAKCQLERGWLLLERGELAQAIACFQPIEHDLKHQPVHVWRGLYGLGICAARQGDALGALRHHRRACAIVADLRRALASEHASSGIFRLAHELFRDTLRLAHALNEPLAAIETADQLYNVALERQLRSQMFAVPPELQAEYTERQRQLQALLDLPAPAEPAQAEPVVRAYIDVLLRARHAEPVELPAPVEPLDLGQLRARCGAHFGARWSVLYYIECEPGNLLVVELDAEQLELHHIALSAADQKSLARVTNPASLAQIFLDIPFLARKSSRPWESLEQLGGALVPAPVRAKLGADHRLLIVPSVSLQRLPWAALRIDGAWLAERAVVQLLPSLRIWSLLTERASASSAALLIGVSTFNGRAQPLASVQPSLDLVARGWPGPVTRLADGDVTRQGLLRLAGDGELREFGLLHIATHGRLIASSGLLAHLKLRGEDLFYDDLTRLRLGGALVVLAACEGSAGEVLAGEEVLSLSRAFIVAGARDVISSHYSLYDNAVLKVLGPLYERLAGGDDAPTALARAQRSVIAQSRLAGGDAADLSPLAWASFNALGAGVLEVQRVVPGPLQR